MSDTGQEVSEREQRKLRRERYIVEQERQRMLDDETYRIREQRQARTLENMERRKLELERRELEVERNRFREERDITAVSERLGRQDERGRENPNVDGREMEEGAKYKSTYDRSGSETPKAECSIKTPVKVRKSPVLSQEGTGTQKVRLDIGTDSSNMMYLEERQHQLESEIRRKVQLLKTQGVELSPNEEMELCGTIPKSYMVSPLRTNVTEPTMDKRQSTTNTNTGQVKSQVGKVSWSDDLLLSHVEKEEELESDITDNVFDDERYVWHEGHVTSASELKTTEYRSLPRIDNDYQDAFGDDRTWHRELKGASDKRAIQKRFETDATLQKARSGVLQRTVRDEKELETGRSKRIRMLEAELQRKENDMKETERNVWEQERVAKRRELERREVEKEKELQARILEIDRRRIYLEERRQKLGTQPVEKKEGGEDGPTHQMNTGTFPPEPEIGRWDPRGEMCSDNVLRRRERELEKWSKDLKEKEDTLRRKEQYIDEIVSTRAGLKTKPRDGDEQKHYTYPKFTVFSGEDPKPKMEATYEEWAYEVKCIRREQTHSDDTIAQAIRKSLRGQAKRVLIPLGTTATVDDMLEKLEKIFGNVASGESILQSFYLAAQRADESVAAWGLRLEEILQVAIDKGHVDPAKRNSMLKSKFWRALRSEKLRNATRVYFETIDDFECLRREIRAEEHEMKLVTGTAQHRPVQIQEKGDDAKLDLLLKKITALEQQIQQMGSKESKQSSQPSKQGTTQPKTSYKKKLN